MTYRLNANVVPTWKRLFRCSFLSTAYGCFTAKPGDLNGAKAAKVFFFTESSSHVWPEILQWIENKQKKSGQLWPA
ncbi:hypothetical protein [Achromobacter animicus]|uniref:hypothetical protein n=1 Tax=Achromobacter animicus TaxID=1389935 RepID=UPI0024481C54|nr:hypothetical protein [Achromobacter animicus]MDH0681687.1 hypothetical protein [Achromobacter animicus]